MMKRLDWLVILLLGGVDNEKENIVATGNVKFECLDIPTKLMNAS